MISKEILGNKRQISLWLMIAFYLAAGINHFRMPEFYYPLTPDYLGYKQLINIISGVAEILLAIGLIIPSTRKISVYGIILMLIAFIPAHVWMIQKSDTILFDGIHLPVWIAWVRLVVIHPVLLFWAWSHRNTSNP
ncbi:MAG: DoxX family protein [Chitinophagaceae bacterium]|nr:DoxX family protein [Chitinophagaceae bacterium]